VSAGPFDAGGAKAPPDPSNPLDWMRAGRIRAPLGLRVRSFGPDGWGNRKPFGFLVECWLAGWLVTAYKNFSSCKRWEVGSALIYEPQRGS